MMDVLLKILNSSLSGISPGSMQKKFFHQMDTLLQYSHPMDTQLPDGD